MRLRVDCKADALYLHLDDSDIVESVEVAPGILLDYNQAEHVVGVEMLSLSTRSPGLDVSDMRFETGTSSAPDTSPPAE